MDAALQCGLRGLSHAECYRIDEASGELARALARIADGAAERLERAAVAHVSSSIGQSLPVPEKERLLGRALARAMDNACEPLLDALVNECYGALAGEVQRLARFADAIDLVIRANGHASAAALSHVLAEILEDVRLIQSGSESAATPRRQAARYALAIDLGLVRAGQELRTGKGEDAAERVRSALANFPRGEALERALRCHADAAFSPLQDAIDHHLDGVSAA